MDNRKKGGNFVPLFHVWLRSMISPSPPFLRTTFKIVDGREEKTVPLSSPCWQIYLHSSGSRQESQTWTVKCFRQKMTVSLFLFHCPEKVKWAYVTSRDKQLWPYSVPAKRTRCQRTWVTSATHLLGDHTIQLSSYLGLCVPVWPWSNHSKNSFKVLF